MATTYYVDSDTGRDTNPGRSPAAAWRSLERVNEATFLPEDRILFKAGTRYASQLKPKGSGRVTGGKVVPITVDMYGQGPKPRIDAEGKYESAVYLYNVQGWEVRNLEITNTGPTRKPRRRGVVVRIRDFGTARHIKLEKLYIHDVNGSLVKKSGGGGGILWQNEGRVKKSRFDGLRIENCHLVRCTRNGINARGYSSRSQWYPSLNVVIRGNLLEEIPGDGIVPIACDGALVERNVMRNCPRLLPIGEAAAGIWPWSCDNTVIQFNEVSDHKAPWDAQGFDSDWNCRRTLIQYNYSHDNEGGFLLICNNGKSKMPSNIGNIGTVVRYNISVNDGLRPGPTRRKGVFSPTFHISGPCKDTKIYNNVIYVPKKPSAKIDRTILKMDNWGGPWPVETWFANNIFYVEGEGRWLFGKARKTVFTHNAYWGRHVPAPQDASAVRADPRFVTPGRQGAGLAILKAYMLRAGSPCIGAATGVPDPGKQDFFGRPLPKGGPKCIGIHEAPAPPR